MAEMVEPDRTIMIVSIIGLVIIWGSFFYHKYVQGGGENGNEGGGRNPGEEKELPREGDAETGVEEGGRDSTGREEKRSGRESKGRGKKKKKR